MKFQECSRRMNKTCNRLVLLLSSMNHENKVRLFMIRFQSFLSKFKLDQSIQLRNNQFNVAVRATKLKGKIIEFTLKCDIYFLFIVSARAIILRKSKMHCKVYGL